jgi:hypothetical protein
MRKVTLHALHPDVVGECLLKGFIAKEKEMAQELEA